ncbi:MAG: ankyrin repeat domain-containing protein [bacterium]
MAGIAVAATVLVAAAMLPAATPPNALIADAAMKGDIATMRKLIAQGERVNSAQGDGMTALHWAADRGDSAMTLLLLKSKADVRAVTRIGHYTPLLIASRTGSAAVVTALLDAGSDTKAVSEAGATSLHLAAAAGNPAAVAALIDHGADVNAREPMWGQTPLIFAAAYDRGDAIRVLLKRGADASVHTKQVNLTEDGAREQAAARKRNEVLVSFEPEKHRDTAKTAATGNVDTAAGGRRARTERTMAGAEVAPATTTAASATGADTAAAGRGRGGRAAAPVPKGPFTPSQIQAAIDSGRAVLMAPTPATPAGFTEQVDTINGGVAGYVGSVGGQGGLSALHHAAREGNVDAVVALLDGGANINDPSGVDHTSPLLSAMINGQFDVAKVLIEHGADPNIESTSGNTPLYAAINTQWAPRTRFPQPQEIQNQKASYLDLMSSLLKAGANPNARIKQQFWYFSFNNCGNANCGLENIDGTTVFWRAAYALDVDAMRMLVKAGADPNIPSAKMVAAAGSGRGRIAAGAARGDSAGGGRGGGAGAGAAAAGGRGQIPPPVAIDAQVDSAAKAVKPGTGVFPIHCAAGVGYGNGFAGNSHRHVTDGWMPAMKYLVEELHADVNQRDVNGYTPLHHAAARGDNEMIQYLVSKGADARAVASNFRTTADMANGPVQRLRPFPETIALLEKLGSKNSHRCVGC